MAQDNIKNLYEALKNDYDLGSEQDFRNSLKDANNRRNLYNAIGNDYDLGSEQDFENSLGYGNTERAERSESAGAFTQEEYSKLSPTAQEVAKGVGIAPQGENAPDLMAATAGAKIGGGLSFETMQDKPNEPNKADLQRVQEGMQRVQAREPKAQFVPKASNIVMATPTAETLKRYPWLKADEAVPFNRETGEPLYTWTDEQGRPISRSEIGIMTAKQEITGEREYMQQQPASLELPDSNARAMRLDGSLTEYVDVLMKEKYGDDYLNRTFTTADGRQVSGSELMTETAQQQYNELNNDINNARIEYLDADEGQRKELVDALSKKYQGWLTRESIERTMNDEQAQIEARETQRQRERQQIDEAYNKAYTDRAAVMQENARKAKEEYENSSWLDRMFGGNPVQRAYWMNQNDKRIQIAETQINIALDARRVLDTGKAYDEGESWGGRLVRGMRDAMTDTGLYDGGVEEMHDLRNVKEAVDAYEAGTATDAQKDLLDTYSLLTMVNGENADALGGMYGAGQMTIQAIPFMAQMYINPIGSLGQSTMKAATRYGLKTFGRSTMNRYMKRLLTTSLKAGGRVTGDMLAAALPAMTFGAPAIGADMYDRLIGNARGIRNKQGNIEYSGRDNAETSKAAAIAKSIGSNYLEYQSEMVGEYFRPLSNIISRGFGRATDKLGLGKVRDMIANISNKDFYRAYADFARRTQWQGTFNEYLEEVVNNVENALFIGDMDFSTDENGVFNLDTNIDTFLGVAVMSGFMSSLKTVDYIRTKGRLKDALDNAYTSGLDVFGTNEWQRITDEIDGLDDKTAASAVKKMLNNVDSDEKKRTIINYATAALANQGFNAGELKNSLEQVSDAAVNGGVPQDAIPGIENLAPEERQNVHVDGMIHAAVLYPTAENGQPQEVFITRGNVVMREDGTIDTEASDKEIYYKGADGQVHIVSPDKLQAVAEPISVENYVAANRPNEANEPDMAEEIVPGQVVNINVDGQTFQATVQGTDGNGNVSVYYQDANGMDRPATFTIDEIRNANRPNNEEPPAGGAGAVVESVESNGANEPNASQTAEDRMPIDVSEYFGNAEEAMATAKDIIQNGEVIGTLPDGSVQMQKDGFVVTLMPDGNGGMNVTGIERTGNNRPQNIPENGNIGAKNIQQTDGISTENGGISAENIQQEQQIPQDDEGNLIYDQVPVEATIADLYDGSLNDDEVQGFIDANINEAQKKYDSVQKKAPKIGTNKAKYLEQKRKWQADVDEAKRVLDYWNEVNSQKQALTHTTEEETQAAQAELSGQNAREEFNQYNENGVNDAVSVASDFIRGAKITPESFRTETGYGTGEQRRFVGMIASEQNGGKSIDRLAEELVSYDNAELNGVTFNGDTSAAKDAILEALQSAGTRGELTTDNTAEQERYVEARRAELDAQCMEAYGMTYEDYLAYEEQNLPEMLRKYANFDEVEFYNLYADEIEQSLNARINEQGNDTAGEEPRTGGGNEVLPEQGIGNAGGSEGGTEQGTEVPAGVQGTVEDGAVPEEAQQLEPEPIGTNRFGNIYNWVKGQFQSAASFLNNLKSGYLRGVFYRDGIGNIDMVWGNEKAGLQHIINKHIEEADDFNSVEEAMQLINETINNGTISQQGTNISLDYKGYRVSIAQSNEGNWVLTAFDKTRSRAEKQRNKRNATIGDQSVSDMENGTLVSPQLASSESKDTQTSANEQTVSEKIAQEEAKVEQNPTEAQKEAGNYKKGHVKIDGYDVTIENPKGSVRSGVDRNGQEWSVTMNNTYGYIRGTEGVDGDHIDVFLSDDPTQGDVYVIDQVNEDGSFDEHKVMYGFKSALAAKRAYLANYSPGWKGLGTITKVSKEEFKKWINSSHRKTKPFAEYKSVNEDGAQNEGNRTNEANEPDRPLSLADIREAETSQPTNVVEQTAEVEQEQTTESDGYGANNKLVSRDRYEELKKRMRQKLGGQLNMGIDPEILAIGTEMAAYHIEAGARKFADYARHMIADLGDAIRPYLKSFYNGARDLPEVQEAGLADEMTPYDEVRTFDTANFDKPTVDAIETAHTVVQEQEVNKQAEEAKNILTTQRNEKERQKRSRNKKKSVSSQQTPDLFGNVNAEQNQEDDNYGLQRNDGAVRAEGLPTDRGDTEEPSGSMGETVGQESGRPDRSGEESGSGELRRSLQQSERLDGQLTPRNRNNNHVERGTDYAPTTPKARYDANVEAVRLAKELTDSGQQATDEQKAILRQFSGWGGLGTFFNNERTRNELVALLGDDGYQQAAMSINSAYYTPADVIDAMWDIVKNLGFKGGNILEGSAGIGNILGLMPMDISDRSNIEAVEIDGVSGMILKLLYPDAKVDIQGFENTQVRNGSVDLAITNVPFVTGLHVHDTTGDRDLSRRFGNIHDFCIAKNVRKLREGGIGVFISSSGTLDKSKALREWVVNEGNADFIGAFRLNNKTFGGTTATSDIIVVRKRVNGNKSAGAIDLLDTESVRTVSVPINDNGREKIKPVVLQYNKYFVEHPENMGGKMALNYERGETFRPEGSGLFPTTGINQEERMQQWAETFKDKAVDVPQPQTEEPADTQTDTNGNEIKDGTIVVGEDGSINVMYLGRQEPLGVNDKKVKGHTKAECVEDYNRIKRALNAVLEYETTNEKDDGLKPLLKELNDAYDSFKDKYGNLNKNTTISFLRNDIDFPSIQALEKFNETNDKDGKRIVQTEKTSIFTERVVQKEVEPHPTNVLDAVKTSVFRSGRIDLDYISNALGRDVSDIEKEIIDNGLGYRDPATGNMEVSYEYLSGNVRQKLAIAEANNEDGRYDKNIKALRKVMPMDIPAHLIEFTFGSSWVNPKLFSDYVNEKTGVPVTLTNVGGQWNMDLPYYTATEKNKSEGVRSEKLNKIVLGTDLMNAAINNRTITVSTTQRTWDGRTETITDKEATQACAAKIDDIRNDFKDWARAKMQSDPEMAKEIEQVYNERFNNYVPKTVTEEFMPDHFPGATKIINLYPHQKKAVIRATSQPLMLAHEVGTGKTFTLITTAMEMRRLGLARKPMIVVQNATVGQFVASAKELYPNAKVLTIADNERNEEGRKRFYAKIKYNDWDMIVVPQSVFERIPDSEERQMDFINDRIEEKEHVLEQIQEIDPKSMIARNAKRELDSLQTELAEVSDKKRQKDEKRAAKTRQNAAAKAQEQLDRATDDVENFDDMEIDAVLVDEAHEYKHLGFSTAMQRGVKGVDPSYSKKSAGVYLKTRAVMEKSNGKNVVFATGTPISNTAAEIWTFMRYLMPKHTMEEYGIYYFDDFVRNFGNLTQMLEFTTSGKFRENNRFSGYVNIPELIRIWSSVSDTVLTKETNLKDKLPETVDGGQKATDIYLPQSASLRSIMKAVRAELERFDNMSGKEKKENSAIPLVMYGIAKAAAIDPRLVMAEAADEPVSKTNRAVEETLKSLEATKDYKGTVAIFCDTYQNNQTGFNIYEEIKRKLVERGVPENQIVIMRSGMSVNKKAEIFDKVNAGDVRVIMGSTFTLGTGVNIQERLNTLIHVDAPNRPMDYTQRNGRILRQGNLHKQWGLPVKILRFGVEDSLDITAYQRLKTKGAIADSVMEGKKFINNNQQDRTLEEQEDVFGDTVAQLSGSEYALLKNQAERDFRKYNNKKKQYETDQIYVHNAIPRYEGQIKRSEDTIKQQQKALTAVEKAFPDGTVQEITIGNSKLSSQKAIGDYIKDVVNKKQTETEDKVRKGAQGTKASSSFTIKAGPFTFTVNTEYSKDTEFQNGSLFPVVHRNMTYSCDELGLSNVPVQRASFKNAVDDIMNNVLSGNDMRERIETENNSIERNRSELEQLKSREGKPFENEKELEDARKKVEEYTEKMRKEMEAKEQKYAEMDAQTQSADLGSLSGAEEAEEEELQRSGDGALTDDELSLANDPAAALTGRPTRTAAQRRAFAERERQRMMNAVQELARKLHLDNVDIVTDTSTLQGRRARAKGFYSRSTGRITIVIPNHTDMRDVEQTLLHEAVAHYGLRQLFGEHFDTFLDNVYNNVDPELKRRIDAIAQRHGWSTRTATEEYLASLAENTNFEDMDANWWSKIKDYFLRMLHKIGFKDFDMWGEYLTDNELRYLLWRSYENLAEPGRYRSIIGEVRDIAKQHELNVGNYSSDTDVRSMSAENDDIRYREADEAEDDLDHEWQDEYDRRTLSAAFKFTEAAQDGMKSVSILQDIISKETGKPIKENENVWALQNRLSSTNKYEQDYFYENFYKPLMRTVGNLVKAGARYDELGRNMEDAQDDILKYLISKHGIERNAHFREVAAMEARQPYEESIEEIRKAVEEGEITRENADKQIEKLTEQANEAEEKSRIDTITRDYSGLSELYNNKMDFDALAEQYVSDFESKFDTADLWNKINAATKMTLRKTYEAGLISRSGYEATRDMYQYYIPLRGWNNDVASEMYNYKGQQGVGGRIMKRAKGRKSLAENPLAVIGRMGQDGILQANKNRVKQRLYNLAIGHDTSLLSISKQWYVNEGTKENPDWQRAYPELSGDMGADEVATALKEFDEKMKALKDEGMATQRRDGLTLKYHTTTAQEQQHRVNVSIGGREYNIYVNGNPRASQAINGELRMDEGDSSIVQRVNRWLANVYTSLNPEFVVTNYERDAGFAAAIVASTETPQYQAGWIKNMAKFNPLTTGVYINSLINKAMKGRVNPENITERYMQEFLANGGETGFTNMLTADDYKKLINKEIKNVNTGITARKAANVFNGAVQRANRVFEDATRFATYVTSREQGRSIDEAIRDAKEISLNFNTRGADGMRNDGIVHKFFRNLRHWVIFTNPSIQGLNKAGVAVRNHPVRSTIAIAGLPVLLGYGMAALASALLGDDDDEKVREAYMDLPKWVRRTNICIPIGGTKFVTIPLSYELRVSYGMGEMFWEIEQGLIEPGELAKETLTQISDLLPLSFASGTVAQNVSPTIVRPLVDIIQNKDFTGRPIWRENTFNQNMPEYTKAYAGTAKWFTKSAEMLNNAIPKFWIKDYPSPDKYTPGALDINPAIVEHLFDNYLGGLYTFPAKAAKTISMIWDEDMRDVRNIPFINRNLKDSRSGNPINKSAGDRYNTYMREYRLSKQRWDGYRRETNHGVTDFLEKLTNFGNTPQGQRMFIIDGYKKSLDDIDKQIKDMGQYEGYGGDEERKRLKNISDSLKQELVNKLDSVSVVED